MTHADELIYLFPFPLMTGLNEEETRVSHTMTDMWTNFAIYQWVPATAPNAQCSRAMTAS